VSALLSTKFHRWANGLRRGGLRRKGDEGTSGERCAFLAGGHQKCGLCGVEPQLEVDDECLAAGHPRWYCSRVLQPIYRCPEPEGVIQRNFASFCWWAAVWALALALTGTPVVIWLKGLFR
tara:strand:+ start:239 stop:601 length:363 start_codon:yes stop_codon:yes gene_type:complete